MTFDEQLKKTSKRFQRIAYHQGILDMLHLVQTTLDAAEVVEEDPADTILDIKIGMAAMRKHSEGIMKKENWTLSKGWDDGQ